jgi:hypothetical protein
MSVGVFAKKLFNVNARYRRHVCMYFLIFLFFVELRQKLDRGLFYRPDRSANAAVHKRRRQKKTDRKTEK